jgi:DNA-binding NarL/FixJ family response regulator
MKRPLLWDVSLSELQALYDLGFTQKDIAKQLNVSVVTINKYLKGYKRKEKADEANDQGQPGQ